MPDQPCLQWIEPESRVDRGAFLGLALAVGIGFLLAASCFWVPANGGTDQNGYLFGGKLFSQTLTMGFTPTRPGTSEFDPHQFVGRMWVGADLGSPAERYYPKYPLGLPFLYAIAMWVSLLFRPGVALYLAYGINPIAMALAVVGTFFVARQLTGSFGGFLTTVVFATSPVTVRLSVDSNSHATAVCCVVWGMYFLLSYWRQAGVVRAMMAGVLLGYAGTIRYSEATLILPILLVGWFALSHERLYSTVALLLGWAIPIGLLLIYNRFAIGATTGYDPTHESGGFRLEYAVDNWETMLRQLDTNGLSLLLPFCLAGLVCMFWWNWRVASVLTSWIMPCMLIYMFYYWAPDNATVSYLRFFTTILPGLGLCFFWLVTRLKRMTARYAVDKRRDRSAILFAILAIFVALPIVWLASMHLWLGDFSAVNIGWHLDGRLVRWLTPGNADVDAGAIRAARVAFAATFGWAAVGACATGLIVLGVMRGKFAFPEIGGGLLTALVAGMHLTNALPGVDQDQIVRLALQSNVQEIRATVPNGSVLICSDNSVLNDVQFDGDYTLYSGDTFRRDYVQQLPAVDPDSPQGLDPGRCAALFARLKSFDQNALDQQARRLVNDALSSRRRVFVVLPRRDTQSVLKRDRIRPAAVNRKAGQASAVNALTVRKNLSKQLPDLIQRLCAGDQLTFDVAATWITYTPRMVMATQVPRGLRLAKPDMLPARRGMELLEITTPVRENG